MIRSFTVALQLEEILLEIVLSKNKKYLRLLSCPKLCSNISLNCENRFNPLHDVVRTVCKLEFQSFRGGGGGGGGGGGHQNKMLL